MADRAPPAADSTPRRPTGLATRIALVTTAVAAVSVLLAGGVSLGQVRGAARQEAAAALARQASVVAALLVDPVTAAGQRRETALRTFLRRDGVQVVVLRADQQLPPPGLTSAQLATLQAGGTVSTTARLRGTPVLVQGQGSPDGTGAVLYQAAATASGSSVAAARRRLVLSLLVGLVGGALAGLVLARWLARPLADLAAAAHRLAGGQRGVPIPAQGPAEVVEVADAVAQLDAALATSEGREREFLLSVSHELRTPLTAVRGYAEALADGVVPADGVAATGTVMLAEAERLDRLVSDLLDLARLRASDFRVETRPVDLAALVRDAATVWADRCAREGCPLLLAAVPTLVVRTDPLRVRQIIDGLAENALRVTPAGAPIVLATYQEPGWAVLQVRDGGPGLAPEDLPVAFERGVLHARYRGLRPVGTGLGLALVAGLAERLGGTAAAGRAPEGGAAFTIRLPMRA